jgi:sortase A
MKKLPTFIYIIIGLLLFGSLGVFATTLTHALTSSKDETEVADAQRDALYARAASSTLPARLVIPKIGVDARVQPIGISKHGTMAVPTNYTDVGWYKYAAIPGHSGTAVIDGHLDNGFGKDAVFKRLGELEVGDEVLVTDQAGKQLHFRVYQKQTLHASTTDTTAVFKNTDRPLLNLITCDGAWDAEKKQYAERKVLFTEISD